MDILQRITLIYLYIYIFIYMCINIYIYIYISQNGINAENEKNKVMWKHLIQESDRMRRWVARAEEETWQKHRSERLSGWTSENTGGKWHLCIHLWAFQSHIYLTSMYWAHITAWNSARCCRFSRNKTDMIPAFILAEQILQRGIPSWKRTV